MHRSFSSQDIIVLRSLCLLRARNMEAVETSWPVSTAIVFAHAAEKKVKVQILVFLIICQACNSLTEEQRLQLSTPSYRIKKTKTGA